MNHTEPQTEADQLPRSNPAQRATPRPLTVRSNIRAGAPHTIKYTDVVKSTEHADEWSTAT